MGSNSVNAILASLYNAGPLITERLGSNVANARGAHVVP